VVATLETNDVLDRPRARKPCRQLSTRYSAGVKGQDHGEEIDGQLAPGRLEKFGTGLDGLPIGVIIGPDRE
jgi:hypothetical protein